MADDESFDFDENYFTQGDHIKAMEVIEDSILAQGKDKVLDYLNFQQGTIFKEQSRRTENSDVKFTFLLGSVECFAENEGFSSFCSVSLFELGQQLGSSVYYKKAIDKAKEYLSILATFRQLELKEQKSQKDIESLLKDAESRIAGAKTLVRESPMNNCEPKVMELKKDPDPGLRLYWMGLNDEFKRNFMKVSTSELISFVEGIYSTEGRYALEEVLTYARENRKWRFWMCRKCSKKFSSPKECTNHLGQEHGAEFKSSSRKDMAQGISKVWARKISVGGWEPVNAVAAVEMIMNQLEDVKAFSYVNGWSQEWPLAVDEERSQLLQEIRLLLVSFWECKILSCSIRDWMMQFPVKHLAQFEVSKLTLTDCRLMETPQSICFLECRELNKILDVLKNIKCERDDGTGLVCRAVDSFCSGTRAKEKIDFDPQISCLLLDKRLLQCKIARFDDEGSINVFDPDVHYAKAHAQGVDILSWLEDCSSGDESFRFPRAIRTHNLDFWVAVLRAVQFTCRTLGTKYSKKWQLLDYDAALTDAKNLCIREDERRRNFPEDQWNMYASLLCDKCEEHIATDADARDSLSTKLLLSVVQDVLKGAAYPTFDFIDIEDCMNVIRERKILSDDIVLKSIDLLKLVVTNKVPVIDSKILLIENSRINLLNDLTRLSVFDYRSYILRPLKELLLAGLKLRFFTEVAEAETNLLLKEVKRPQSKKKKNKSNKRTSMNMSSPLDKTVEYEPFVNLELEDSMEQEDLLSSERGPLEISFNTNNQEGATIQRTSASMPNHLDQNLELEGTLDLEDTTSGEKGRLEISSNTYNQGDATKDMQNIPGEGLLSEHSELAHVKAATRYNSALDMILKALCNIKVLKVDLVHNRQPFSENLEEQVPYALQDFFSAVISEQIKEEGVYSDLLSKLLASLEEVHSLSSDTAEVVFAILEFLHCWKSPERESLVTRLFTLEEYEGMSCRKCRRKPNYPEQSSYGIVMAADSIRDLKCTFGSIKFEDILKIIQMEEKMFCDIKTGGCGNKNFIHHTISRCSPIFTIMLEWQKNETEKEISETTNALDWEIDISRLYEGLEPNTKYRLVSMVSGGEEGKHICMAYKKNWWVSLSHETLAEEVVGNWKSVVRFCGERKVRPEILFYEALQWPNK